MEAPNFPNGLGAYCRKCLVLALRTAALKEYYNDDLFGPTRSAEAACDAAAWKAGDDVAPREMSTRPDGTPLLSERVVERTRAHTAVVNDRLADERQRRETDDAAMDKLSQLADMYASHNVNRSMGAKPGVDAAAIDGGEVDSDEWGDSD